MAAMAADAPDGAPLPLMDPALLLSLVPRLQEIGRLLDQVRVAPIEQSVTMEPPTRDPAATGAAPPSEPLSSSLALGTVNENDDDWDPWIASDGAGASTSHIPAALQTQLAQEATALQRTLAQAHAALDAAPGADMSIDDQVDLLDRLGAYRACQAYVSATYTDAYRRCGRPVWPVYVVPYRWPWTNLRTNWNPCTFQHLLGLQKHGTW